MKSTIIKTIYGENPKPKPVSKSEFEALCHKLLNSEKVSGSTKCLVAILHESKKLTRSEEIELSKLLVDQDLENRTYARQN